MGKEVAIPTQSYETQEARRQLLRLLRSGTRELRKPGNARIYLPPEEDEETSTPSGVSEWDQRIGRAVIHPYLDRAVKRAVAAIFRQPVILGEDVPTAIGDLWEDVDRAGNLGDVFFSRVVDDSLGDAGLSYVLVDHPRVPDGATRADLKREGKAPYLVHLKARSVFGVQHETFEGRVYRRKVRIWEPYTIPGEFEDEAGKQIRVLTVQPRGEGGKRTGFVTWEIWRKTDPEKEDSWEPVDGEAGTMEPHYEIPMTAFYSGYIAPDEAISPFEDLGFLNMLHTQKESDIDECFRISLGAQLHRSGISREDAMKQRALGPKRLLVSEDPEARAEWLERTGSAAQIALEAQDRLEARMRALSSEPHIRRTGDETATGRAIDEAEAKTEVQAWALGVKDTIEVCFGLLATSLGEPSGGSVTVQPPPRLAETDNDTFKLMLETHKETGVPRQETLLAALKRRGALPDDFDIDAEVEAARREAEPQLGATGRLRGSLRTSLQGLDLSPEDIESRIDAAMAGAEG